MIESPSGCAIDSSVPGGTRRFAWLHGVTVPGSHMPQLPWLELG